VACLMDGPCEALSQVTLLETCRHAHISRVGAPCVHRLIGREG
jgi:hypothetical protein